MNKVVTIKSLKDIDNINKSTKYINLDLTNLNEDVLEYFLKYGQNYYYSSILNGINGYTYINYEVFKNSEDIISEILYSIPDNLNNIEISKYLYITLGKLFYEDINLDPNKNEEYSREEYNSINNIWGILYYHKSHELILNELYSYLLKRLNINSEITIKNNNIYLLIKTQSKEILTNIYQDIPFVWTNMHTRNFGNYNEDINIDKKIKYLKNNYPDINIDKSLKNINYEQDNFLELFLNNISKIIDISILNPVELSKILKELFKTYCSNKDININNFYVNKKNKSHFIMISYDNKHYSYNYSKNKFISISDKDLEDNISNNKIKYYLNEELLNKHRINK